MVVGLLGAFALLLGVAGVMKLFAPDTTARAIVATKLPAAMLLSHRTVVRIFGMAEVGIAVLVVLLGGRVSAVLLAAAYAFLAVTAGLLIRRAPGQDCGCFGHSAEPVTKWHVGVDSLASIVAVAAVAQPQRSLVGAARDMGAAGVVLVVGVVLLGWLIYLTMTALPALLALNAKVAAR